MARVAIWGATFFDNFGDDLMAWGLAREALEAGHEVSIYDAGIALRRSLSAPYENDVELLVEWADVLVVSGGAWLRPPKVYVNGVSPSMSRLEALIESAERYRKPIRAISIGGAGDGSVGHAVQFRLLNSPALELLTLRLAADVAALEGSLAVRKADVFPDIVWHLAAAGGPAANQPSASAPIGLNISTRRRRLGVLPAVTSLRLVPSVPVRTLNSLYPGRSGKSDATVPGLEQVSYESIQQFLDAIAECSTVISTKLHVGVAAMAMGVPFQSLRGQPKTRSFLSEAGYPAGFERSPLWLGPPTASRLREQSEWLARFAPGLVREAEAHVAIALDGLT